MSSHKLKELGIRNRFGLGNRIINAIQSKSSHGYDEISTKILKISASCISSPLTNLHL